MSGPTGVRLRGEAGQVGGIEAIPFGLLVFVVGTLLIANAWAVIDAKFATDAGARQAARTFVEADDPSRARAEAVAAAKAAVDSHGRDPERASVTADEPLRLERCARATFVVTYEVPALSIPFVGGFGRSPFEVRSTHSEIVDPFRSGVPGDAAGCS